jgi:hypothetical protein
MNLTSEDATQCEGCGDWCAEDEVDRFDLPHGFAMLCLECGPEENYANLV